MTTLSARNIDVAVTVGGHEVLALNGVSFDVEPGEVLGIIGESGAGKSMIGRLIGRLLPPQFRVARGALRFKGQDLHALTDQEHRALLGRDICFIPQEPRAALDPVMTIGAQFHEHLERMGIGSRAERTRVARDALAAVKLPDPGRMLHCYAHQLSGGQCQRVLIAMAFASKPALIVADEPTTALDVMTQAVIVKLLADLCREHGTAVILITHDLKLALHVCDKTLVLYAGEVAESGRAGDLYRQPAHPYTRALQLVNPPLTGPRRELVSLPDHMPTLGKLADVAGCRFASRCPQASAECSAAPVPLTVLSATQAVRCIKALPARGLEAPERLPPLLAHMEPAPESAPAVLEVSGLSKQFRRAGGWFRPGAPVVAVKDFNLKLAAGEFVGIVGQSGSGKSTVARLLVGLETPTSGAIRVDGRSVVGEDKPTRALRVDSMQMIFQDPQSALNPRRTLGSLVTCAMTAGHERHAAPDRLVRARELLAATGLGPDMVSRYPAQLSGGQRQRVNIARALCKTPRILIADEILSGLDVSVQAQILNLLLKLRRESDVSLILISHDIAAVRYLCSRVLVMHDGEVVESGPVDSVLSQPRHEYTRRLVAAIPPDDVDSPWPRLAA
ncbi:MAG: ABC transporter ATP-binding protein [Pantoea sp.]|uniref:dipeptide ABC transporter ATP-binding protein n=1 Tax=Pantoea sp. TaxID=69393 RepID=UPI0023854DC5|nr:ABC transporter ATP-binding protein [Pantoea sp.]MDE1186859.1 ABC transporter ATP-binding protein [Pantoea sp.]